MQLTLIALGGAAGALLRFITAHGVHALLGRGFPYGTLVVNVLGSLLIGLVYVVCVERDLLTPALRAGLTTGLLGAFTTFSTFSLETLVLIENAELARAAANVTLSVALCLLGCWLGLAAGRAVWG